MPSPAIKLKSPSLNSFHGIVWVEGCELDLRPAALTEASRYANASEFLAH